MGSIGVDADEEYLLGGPVVQASPNRCLAPELGSRTRCRPSITTIVSAWTRIGGRAQSTSASIRAWSLSSERAAAMDRSRGRKLAGTTSGDETSAACRRGDLPIPCIFTVSSLHLALRMRTLGIEQIETRLQLPAPNFACSV